MLFELNSECVFPNPLLSEEDGLLAIGGDLSPERLLEAYRNGIFPWYAEGQPLMWWSLNPRMILFPDHFKCSKTLWRCIKAGKYEVRIDTAFKEVMLQCATVKRAGQDGTWITDEMLEAYTTLHEMGYAHSFESYYDGELVGGLYGVSLGAAFFGESMFATMTDASKVCLAALVDFADANNFLYIDAQQETQHLASLGAQPISKEDFLSILFLSNQRETLKGKWNKAMTEEISRVTLLIGGNQGDRVGLLQQACNMIAEQIGAIVQLSSIYETEAWGFDAEQNFLNQAVVVETRLSAHEVLDKALLIESQLGRVRTGNGYASRTMDIDILFVDKNCIDTPDLIVPHPRIQERNFVLVPLCEIMPNYVHPKMNKTIANLLKTSSDKGKVVRYKV
ncbi:MAG: leucyl/phenylalanyl-tRNA--protein transferase [Bacteroidales bacterium]|nr:leucyl/phenylalanyl-tRNA--protein transferase [Bacteroidales bacterium]